MTDRDQRIVILGGGAAGLSCAWYLERAGFRRVRVLERASSVGGKCSSVDYDGRPYDVGAIFASSTYPDLIEIIGAVGCRLAERIGAFAALSPSGATLPRADTAAVVEQLESRLAALDLTSGGYRSLDQPGFAGLHPDLHLPFAEFVTRHRLEPLDRLLGPFCTGYGYGYFDDVPTAYVLKYMDAPMRRASFLTGEIRYLEEGFGEVWRRIAGGLDVRCGVEVARIERGEDGVRLFAGDLVEEADALIVACPIDAAAACFELDPEERDLFGRIASHDYDVLLARVEGFPDRSAVVPENLGRERRGRVNVAVRRYRDSEVYALYTVAEGLDEDTVDLRLREDVERLGGTLGRVIDRRRWRFFPHVTTGDFRDRFYERLEALQGQRCTWYAGELLNFSSAGRVVEWSRHLVDQYFA